MDQSTYHAKLLAALSTGPKRPADLDDACLGGLWCGFFTTLPPYADALGDLVDEGLVRWHRDDRDHVWYELAE